MATKKLDSAEISRLLKHEKSNSVHTPKWPMDDDFLLLAKATKAEKESVKFKDGRVFNIRYDERWDAIFIKPANGDYTPCGYFDLKRLKEVL